MKQEDWFLSVWYSLYGHPQYKPHNIYKMVYRILDDLGEDYGGKHLEQDRIRLTRNAVPGQYRSESTRGRGHGPSSLYADLNSYEEWIFNYLNHHPSISELIGIFNARWGDKILHPGTIGRISVESGS